MQENEVVRADAEEILQNGAEETALNEAEEIRGKEAEAKNVRNAAEEEMNKGSVKSEAVKKEAQRKKKCYPFAGSSFLKFILIIFFTVFLLFTVAGGILSFAVAENYEDLFSGDLQSVEKKIADPIGYKYAKQIWQIYNSSSREEWDESGKEEAYEVFKNLGVCVKYDGNRSYFMLGNPIPGHYDLRYRMNDKYENGVFIYVYGSPNAAGDHLFKYVPAVAGFLYYIRNYVFAIEFALVLITFGIFWLMMSSAGKKRGREEIRGAKLVQRIPIDVYAVLMFILEWVVLFGLDLVIYSIGTFDIAFVITNCVILALTFYALFLFFCFEIAARVKNKGWWKHTLIYFALNLIYKVIMWVYRRVIVSIAKGIKRGLSAILKFFAVMPMIPKTMIFLGLSIIYIFIFIVTLNDVSGRLFFFFVGAIAFLGIGVYFAYMLKRLLLATRRIAAGDLETPVETKGAIFEIKEGAENLNSLSDSISIAVKEKVKSEKLPHRAYNQCYP